MRILKIGMGVCGFVALWLVCYAQSDPPDSPKPAPTHPAWTRSPPEIRKLVQRAVQLKAGDTYKAVIVALGEPSEDRQLIPKDTTVSHGRLLHYRLSTWEAGLSNTFHDEAIYVDLDTNNVVRKISIRATLTK
jgi:hypothetical protein